MTTFVEKNEPPSYLANVNKHPRDEFITFDEGPHIYTVHGDSTFTSVTTWNHSHFDVFDPDVVIDNMIKRGSLNDPKNKYYGMNKEEIKELWSKKGASASIQGTKLHYDIECYNNYMEVDNDSIEFQYFLQFDSDYPELKPYRTEWMVYYEELKLSGSIDMVYENPDGTLQIYDWKRVLELKTESFGGKCAKTDCISHLPDSNYWHYSLQLNTYKMILEHKYGKKVTGLYLVCLHPDNVYKKYERIEVKVMDKEITDLYNLRLEQVKNGTDQVKKH
jgi:CRISPR/Cas system-associated exonuclease Cas4 (RecB family)